MASIRVAISLRDPNHGSPLLPLCLLHWSKITDGTWSANENCFMRFLVLLSNYIVKRTQWKEWKLEQWVGKTSVGKAAILYIIIHYKGLHCGLGYCYFFKAIKQKKYYKITFQEKELGMEILNPHKATVLSRKQYWETELQKVNLCNGSLLPSLTHKSLVYIYIFCCCQWTHLCYW